MRWPVCLGFLSPAQQTLVGTLAGPQQDKMPLEPVGTPHAEISPEETKHKLLNDQEITIMCVFTKW